MVARMLTSAQAAVEARHVPGYVLAAEVRIGDFGRIIRGRQTPTPDQAERIATALAVDVTDLWPDLSLNNDEPGRGAELIEKGVTAPDRKA